MWKDERLNERYESEVKLKLEHRDELSYNKPETDSKVSENSQSNYYDTTGQANRLNLGKFDQQNEYLAYDYRPEDEVNIGRFLSVFLTSIGLERRRGSS